MWGAGYPVQASFVPPGGAANPFVPAQHAWAQQQQQQQGRFSYGAQQAVQAAYGQSSLTYQPLQQMLSSGTTTTKHAGEEKYIAFSEGNDTEEFVIQTLSGEFTVKGENHGRPFYQKMPVRAGTPPPEVFVYYWDGRDGPSFEGWWFGKAVGGNEVWSHCPEKAMLPPLKGWKIPFQGPARNTFIMMPRSEKLKRENQERASRVKVLEQGASNVINAAQKAVDEAKVVCEKDHGSLDPTILKEVEASLKPHLQALMDQLKNVESAGLGDATKQLESKIRRTHVQATDAISKIKVLVPQIMRVQQEKQSEQRDEKLLKEMLTSITEKFHAAEDLAEKAEITSAMIEHAGEDLVEAQKAAQQTEESAKQAAAAVKEALTAIGLKLAMLKQFESDQGRLKATDALGTFREKLRVANQKLVPFLAAQDTFKAQAEAKYLADELEAKLAPAEVEVDKAEQVAEPLLSFAEAALAAGQAAAEATATPKAKASSSKEKDKKSETSKEKTATLNQLPKAEVVAQAAQNAQEAAVSLQGVVKLLETKRSDQQVLFSAPMKKVLEKAENRVKNAQRKLERIKVAQKELKERETSIALVSDVQEKMESVEKALNLAKEAVAACQGDEQEMLKVATKEVSTAKVALSMRLLEVKRFTAEAGIQAQRSLQEHQQSLQASLAEIEALKKKAAENKEVSKRKEAQRKVEEAEDRAHQAEKSAADIFDESRIASMTAMEIREAGDKNQQAFKGTMEAVRAAQTMITTLQIEAKNKENATTLTHDYAKLQARLRQAEAAVAHCAVLPPAVQAQLQLKAHIDEVESKVKDSEAKVEIAEKMAMEAEKNPLPAEEIKGDTKTSGAGVPAPKAFPSKAMPYKGKAFGKGEAKGEPEATGGPVEKAKAAVEVANLELKMVMRYLEAQAKAERIPEEDMNILKGRIEAAKARVDAASGLLEKAVEKRASLALLGDADKKVFEAEKAVEAAAELAVPLQELMASEEKKPVKAQGGKTSEEDGKEAEDKDQEGEKKEEKDAEKMDEKDEENDEEGKKNKDKKEEKETTDAQGQEKKGEDGEDPKDGKGKGDEDSKEEMKEEMKEEKEEKEPVKEETEEDGEGKTEPSPLEEALAAMNNAAQVASRQLSSAKTTLAVKRISAKRLPGNAPATCLEQLDALQKRLDAAMKRLAEVRRGSTDRQYAKARKAMAQSIEQAEAKVEASKEAFQALMDLPEEADLPKMQQVLQSAAAAQSEATAAIQAARVPLVERLQKAKADGVTTDTSEVLKEFQEMFAKLAPLQSKLDEQRREANDKEHKFVASLLMQEATEMLKEVDGKLARLNEVALPLTKGEELQPLARLGQLLEALRHHASSASKTHATLWGELAKASGGEGGHIIPKGITDALKSLQPELPDLADLLGATEEDAQMLAAGLARMDPEEAAKEDGGISEQKFIEHMKVRYLCVAVVTVTSELEVGSNTVRKLEVNEVLDALGEATRESKSGLERVECKAQQDGAQGFVTIAGSGGTTYLEVYTPFMERVRAAEEALADSHESVSSTVTYLKQKHDELKSTRGSQALNELKQKLQDLRVQATRAQVQYSDVKHKVTEAKNRHDRQLEAHKKRRQTAAEKLAADTITGEASAMVDELIAKATNACNAASSILNVTTSDTPSSTISLQALEQVEKDLLAVVEACAEGEGKIMKTVEKEIRNASKGPLVDARRMMFRLKVKLAPLPNNCKKHLKTIQEKKLMMVEDVQRMVADLLREHARKNNLSADALYEQLRKVPDHADGAGAVNGNADGDANSDRTAEADGAIPIESLRAFLQSVKEMASAELDIALQGFEAGISRFAFFDLVEEYRKCVKEVAVTATIEVKSSITRKLEIDEVVQVLGQPTIEEGSGLLRAPCRILRDNIEGWVTLNGSQGTAYLKRVAKPYYLCEEETSLLDSCASSGQQVSTARKGERLEVLEGPRLETTTEVTRARGRATKDGQVGWVLFKDHSGRCFFELQDLLICRGGVALTDNFDIGACKAIRKLEVGETLQSLEEPRQDESRSLTRIKVRALNDGKEGWATSQGNQGTLYVVETNKHFTCAESVDLEASPGKALRRLEVGEGFELLQDPTVELRQGKSFARGRCSSGQPGEGWFAITGNVQPWTHREELSAKTLSTDVQS